MFRRKASLSSVARTVVLATISVLALTMAEPPTAAAASTGHVAKGVSATVPSDSSTDLSARRRHYRRGNAAGLAAMGLMFGTIGAIIAQQQREDYYNRYGYGGYYGYGPPVYYRPYYGPRYYRYYPY